jgi:YVTN family beta-propeller protein
MPLQTSRGRLVLAALLALGCSESVTVSPVQDLDLEIVGGATPVTLAVTGTVPTAPSVRVVDSGGEPVAGVRVLFVPTKGGGAVVDADVTTGADGIASSGGWTYGQRAGAQELAVAVVSATVDARATFTGTATPGPAQTIAVTPTSVQMRVGQTRQLSASVVDAYGNAIAGGTGPTFASDDTNVATVTTTGLVTGVGNGTATITVSLGAAVRTVPVAIGDRPSGLTVTTTTVGDQPFAVAARADDLVYVARGVSSSLVRFQLPGTAATGNIPTGSGRSADVAFVPGQALAYVTNLDDQTVSVINTTTHALVREVPVGAQPLRVRASPDGAYVFVTTTGGVLKRVSTATDVVETIVLPNGSGVQNGLAVNGDRGVLYVSDNGGRVYEVSIASFTLLRDFTTGGVAQGIAVAPGGGAFYVALESGGAVQVDAASLTATGTVGSVPAFDVALTNDGVEVWVVSTGGGSVTVYSAATRALIRSHPIPGARRIAFSFGGLTAIVASEAGTVTFIR